MKWQEKDVTFISAEMGDGKAGWFWVITVMEKAYRDGRESSGEDRVVFLRDYFDKRDFAGGDGK